MSWKKEILGELVTITKGKKHNEVLDLSASQYIQIEDLFSSDSIKYTYEKGISIDNNDVVIAWDGANAGIVGTTLNGVIGSTLARLRPVNKDLLNGNYLFWYLHSKEKEIKSQRTGATIPHVNGSVLRSMEIPLPDLPTQQRIANILDTADAIRKADAKLLSRYDELLQASFLQFFGDPVKNEKGWDLLKFRNTVSSIIAGVSYGGEDKVLSEEEFGVLKVSAVTKGYFDSSEFKAVNKGHIKRKITTMKKGDFLFSRANTRDLVGATCIVDKDYPHLFIPDKLWKIEFKEEKASTWYVKLLLSHNIFRQNLTKTATGTSGSMLNISMQKLNDLIIPLPPTKLQNQFAKIASEIELQKQLVIQQQQQSENLLQSLLQKAFKGKL